MPASLSWWSNRPLGVKLSALVGAGSLALGVFGVIAVTALQGTGERTDQLLHTTTATGAALEADMMHDAVRADVLQALRAGDPRMLAEALRSDLQAPALHLRPELADVLELGERNGALAGVVSGSGPSIAFLCADLDNALSLQIALSAARHTVVRATGPAPGARLVGE